LRKFLNWINDRYNSPEIYITESGWSVAVDDKSLGAKDPDRLGYYKNYTTEVFKAMNEDGVNIKGYFAWSLMDNYEWEMGYRERFGLIYVDFDT
jgi:beta-glucosidase/6-phospho-beta-glucosidase/beta-galactosidase